MSKNGMLFTYIWISIIAILVLLVVAVFFPLGVKFNTEIVKASSGIRDSFITNINNISNSSIRAEIKGSLNSGIENGKNIVMVNAFFYKWGGLFVILIPLIVGFLITRRSVETTQQGGNLQ